MLGDVRELLAEVAEGLDQALDEEDEPEDEPAGEAPAHSDPDGFRVEDAHVVDAVATTSDPAPAPAEGG